MTWGSRYGQLILSAFTDDADASQLAAANVAALDLGASAAWPAAQRAIYIPVSVVSPFVAIQMLVRNGTAVAGTIDAGIYAADGTLLVHAGASTMTGVTTIQALSITETTLAPGLYYLALTCSSASGQFYRVQNGLTPGIGFLRAIGVRQEALGQNDLKATATFSAPATDYVPLVAASSRSLV